MNLVLPQTRKQSWEWYRDVQVDCETGSKRFTWREAEAGLGRADLFYLLVRLLRRPDANKDWLFARCREVQAEPDNCLDLWAREHYKSTVITFALTMQDILRDREITCAIFSHTRPIAKGFLQQLKREMEDNEILKDRFSDVLWADPKKESPRWSEDGGIIVKRKGNPKEATLEAWGLVDGQPTGKHFNLRIYDDTVTRESVTTPEMVKKTTDAWDLSQNLGAVGGKVRYIGTRYSLHDSYSEIIGRGAAKPRIHAATHNGRLDGKPVFWSDEMWARKLRDSSRQIIAAQQLQNPLADSDATFNTAWLRSYEVRPRTLNVVICIDPSRGRSATSDNTAMAVVGISSSGAKYLLDGACHRMTLSQRWQMMRTLYHRWASMPGIQHVAVGYERYGAQSDDEYHFEQMQLEARRGIPNAVFPLQELNWPRDGTNSKKERVERLEPDFRNSRFFLPAPILHNGKPSLWRVDADPNSKTFGEIEFREKQGLSKAEMGAVEGGSSDLLAKALIVRDPSLPGPGSYGGRYDLTMRFIDEVKVFPFGLHDDLLDSVSRIYDMDVKPPMPMARHMTEPNIYFDGV